MSPIPIWNSATGEVTIRSFDQGIVNSMGALANADSAHPAYSLSVGYGSLTRNVSVYFDQPEQVFQYKVFPFITIHREFEPAPHRWMGVGQLEFRAATGNPLLINSVSGSDGYTAKIQAYPFDITYTISCFDRYENEVQYLLSTLLRLFPPVGKIYVTDSLGLLRSYEAYLEGGITNLQELIDPVNRARGYALTVRVEGELDLADPYMTTAVTGVDLNLYRM